MQLTWRMIKPPGARPAIRSGENRTVAELSGDALEFRSHQIECFIPTHVDECFRAALLTRGAGAAFEITLAHRRMAHAHRAGDRTGQRVANGRRIRVAVERRDARDNAIFD